MFIVGNHDFHACDERFYFFRHFAYSNDCYHDVFYFVLGVRRYFWFTITIFWVYYDSYWLLLLSSFIFIFFHGSRRCFYGFYISSVAVFSKNIFRVACDFHLYLQFTSRQILSVVLLFSDPGYDFFKNDFLSVKNMIFDCTAEFVDFLFAFSKTKTMIFSCLLSFSQVGRNVIFFQNSGFCFRIMVFAVSDVITVRLFCYSLLTICYLWSWFGWMIYVNLRSWTYFAVFELCSIFFSFCRPAPFFCRCCLFGVFQRMLSLSSSWLLLLPPLSTIGIAFIIFVTIIDCRYHDDD